MGCCVVVEEVVVQSGGKAGNFEIAKGRIAKKYFIRR
jgi:hypothetical protein